MRFGWPRERLGGGDLPGTVVSRLEAVGVHLFAKEKARFGSWPDVFMSRVRSAFMCIHVGAKWWQLSRSQSVSMKTDEAHWQRLVAPPFRCPYQERGRPAGGQLWTPAVLRDGALMPACLPACRSSGCCRPAVACCSCHRAQTFRARGTTRS